MEDLPWMWVVPSMGYSLRLNENGKGDVAWVLHSPLIAFSSSRCEKTHPSPLWTPPCFTTRARLSIHFSVRHFLRAWEKSPLQRQWLLRTGYRSAISLWCYPGRVASLHCNFMLIQWGSFYLMESLWGLNVALLVKCFKSARHSQ